MTRSTSAAVCSSWVTGAASRERRVSRLRWPWSRRGPGLQRLTLAMLIVDDASTERSLARTAKRSSSTLPVPRFNCPLYHVQDLKYLVEPREDALNGSTSWVAKAVNATSVVA